MKSSSVLFGGMRGQKLHHISHVFKIHGFMSLLKRKVIRWRYELMICDFLDFRILLEMLSVTHAAYTK